MEVGDSAYSSSEAPKGLTLIKGISTSYQMKLTCT